MDRALFSSSKNTDEAWGKCKKLINQAEKKGALITMVWHTERFNEKEYPGQMAIYEKLIVECKKRGAFICTGKEIFQLSRTMGENS